MAGSILGLPFAETVVCHQPFGNLVRLEGGSGGPPVLLATPLSGHRPLLLRDMALGLSAETSVHLIAWADPAMVPTALGPFGLDENIAYLVEFLRRLGPHAHVIALSQSPLPTLAAASLLAEGGAGPASLTLISGFLDMRINPTRVGLLLSGLPEGWLRSLMLRVPPGRPGQGRLIYPAAVQAQGLLMYLGRHLASMDELWFKLFAARTAASGPSFLDAYFTLADLPAEVVLDMLRMAFHRHALAEGRLGWRGRPIRPETIARAGLMTIEGDRDDISGLGQTRVAHALCRNIPHSLRDHHIEPGAGHFGVFHGQAWRTHILPRVLAFIRRCS